MPENTENTGNSRFLSSPPVVVEPGWTLKKAGSHGIPVNTKTHLIITGMTTSDRAAVLANEVIETEISEVGTVVTTGALSTDDLVAIVAATGFGVSA